MEKLLREAFKLGQQWVKDINDEKEPESFTEWFNKRKKAINYTRCCTELRDEYLQPELDKYKNIKVERTKGRSDM